MIVTAHHDNSANNPMQPGPDEPATWGEMTSQEMMLPWFGVIWWIAMRTTGHDRGVQAPQSRWSLRGRAPSP